MSQPTPAPDLTDLWNEVVTAADMPTRAWLRRTKGLSADEATRVVAEKWQHLSLWNPTFTAALERVGFAEQRR